MTENATPGGGARQWLALTVLCAAFFMVVLDATSVYAALPSVATDLGFSSGGVQWVVTGYMLTTGGLLLLGGRVADLLGRRRVFMVGVTLFALASLVCGLAPSGGVLVAARAVQGTAGAVMTPAALSLLMTVFAEGPARNRALGIWGGLGGVGATAGLLVGGAITDVLGWPWIFFLNLPVGAAILALAPVLLPESRDRARRRTFDVAGAVTVTAALLLLVYAVSHGPEAGWASAPTLGSLAASAALFALFVIVETRSAAPLVPLRIFRSRTLLGGNLVIFTAGLSVDGMLLIVTLYAQEVLGYSAVQFGLAMAVMTAVSLGGTLGGQHLATRFGTRPVAAAGMLLIGVSTLALTRVSVGGSFLGDLFFGLTLFGAGLGFAFVASQIAALSGVREEESGLASGIVETSFHLGGALGVATLSSVAVARTSGALAAGTEGLLAQTQGYRLAFTVAVGFAVVGLLAAVSLLGRRARQPQPADAQPPTTQAPATQAQASRAMAASAAATATGTTAGG